MSEQNRDLRQAILTSCKEADPNPWYPSALTRTGGVPRERLDPVLDELRLGGLIRLTDWVPGQGQGYALTREGAEVVLNPRLLDRVAARGVPRREAPRLQKPAAAGGGPTAWDRGEAIRDALLNPRRPVVTVTLIFLNLVVFAAGGLMALQEGVPLGKFLWGFADPQTELGKQLWSIQHRTGAVQPEDIYLHGQWWRLLSCCFVHLGFLHLLLNMYSLYVIGPLLESMWGRVRYLLLFLVTGVVGSGALVMMERGQGAGASGAIWGILASMVAWVVMNRAALPRALASTWLRQLAIVIVLNAAFTFSIAGISKGAHFGGGLAGLAMAVPLNYYAWSRGWRRLLAAAGVAAVPLVSFAFMLWYSREVRDWVGTVAPEVTRLEDEATALRASASKRAKAAGKPLEQSLKEASEARRLIQRAAEIFRQAGPYQDPGLEEKREEYLPVFENRAQDYEEFEAALAQEYEAETAAGRWASQAQDLYNKVKKRGTASGKAIRLSIQDLRKARGLARQASERLDMAGPYREHFLDQRRRGWATTYANRARGYQRMEAALKGELDRLEKEKREIREMEEVLLPKVNGLEKAALKELDARQGLVAEPPPRRPQAVREALAGLEQARRKLEQAAKLLRQAGPFEGETAKDAREARLDLLNSRVTLFQLIEKKLGKDVAWTKKDQEALEEQNQRLKGAEMRWQQLLK
jgi:membrane associated rhomboid family serine protease